ncbi:MAG: dihydropteroate synthase [Pseudomonadota bacterium]
MTQTVQWADKTLSLQHPQIMGVLNITPDSFSDGGRFITGTQLVLDRVLGSAQRMLDAGASILDVGGESTRPGAEPVSIEVECARVLPVVRALQSLPAVVSIDTRHAAVAREAIAAGAHLVNDVSAGSDPDMLSVIAATEAGFALMHMQGTPATMQNAPCYDNVVDEVTAFLEQRIVACEAAGIPRQRLVIDPGFGFGKTLDHNLQLLAGLGRFKALGCPVLVGLSRKSMLGSLTGRSVEERVHASVAAAQVAVQQGADLLRVHDVAATQDMLSVVMAVKEVAQKKE